MIYRGTFLTNVIKACLARTLTKPAQTCVARSVPKPHQASLAPTVPKPLKQLGRKSITGNNTRARASLSPLGPHPTTTPIAGERRSAGSETSLCLGIVPR